MALRPTRQTHSCGHLPDPIILPDMELPPQPPPEVPAPPPGTKAIRSRRVMKNILWLGAVSIALLLLTLVILPAVRSKGPHYGSEQMRSIMQIDLLLFDFEEEYGRFPDATTIAAVQAGTGTSLALGNSSSNDLFRQLLAHSNLKSERDFWANTATTPNQPNDILGTDALAPGECAFTYISGLTSTGDPQTPVVMTPVIRGTWKFDPKPFKGQAVVLFVDGSATRLPIEKNGDVLLNGMNLFDPRQPFWRGKTPDIKYPE